MLDGQSMIKPTGSLQALHDPALAFHSSLVFTSHQLPLGSVHTMLTSQFLEHGQAHSCLYSLSGLTLTEDRCLIIPLAPSPLTCFTFHAGRKGGVRELSYVQ